MRLLISCGLDGYLAFWSVRGALLALPPPLPITLAGLRHHTEAAQMSAALPAASSSILHGDPRSPDCLWSGTAAVAAADGSMTGGKDHVSVWEANEEFLYGRDTEALRHVVTLLTLEGLREASCAVYS